MLYAFSIIIGLIAGLIITRRPKALLLEQINLLWLLLPAAVLAAAPQIIILLDRDILWRDNNQILKGLISSSHIIFILIVLTNIVTVAIKIFSTIKSILIKYKTNRKIDPKGSFLKNTLSFSKDYKLLVVSFLYAIAMVFLAVGIVAHAAVLLNNQGLMPISENYLLEIDDPVIEQGIRNDALYFKRVITDDTILPELGQTIKLDKLAFLLPSGFSYISPAELIIAVSLFFTVIFSMLFESSKVHGGLDEIKI